MSEFVLVWDLETIPDLACVARKDAGRALMPSVVHWRDHSSSGSAISGADPARQARFDHRAHEARSQEREREGIRHVAFGAALTISDLVDRRSAENLIQPSAPKRNRAQQHGSGFRLQVETKSN